MASLLPTIVGESLINASWDPGTTGNGLAHAQDEEDTFMAHTLVIGLAGCVC